MINFFRAWKFEAGFLLIVGAALLVWAATVYLSPEARKAREANDYLERLQAEYKNDTYGGATPEETLALFIAALEKGDIELASKYFLPEDREKWFQNIGKVQENNHLDEMISDLARAEKSKQEQKNAIFVIADGKNTVSALISFQENQNGIWKITDM